MCLIFTVIIVGRSGVEEAGMPFRRRDGWGL
nr:MAG TPA: hypothetical protein [Caudoviricetes sp.]